jgi:hypothetical protein
MPQLRVKSQRHTIDADPQRPLLWISYDTASYRAQLETTAKQPGRVVRAQGDVGAALQRAAARVSADDFVPHYAHGSMELPAAAPRLENGRCEVWAPSQNPQGARVENIAPPRRGRRTASGKRVRALPVDTNLLKA